MELLESHMKAVAALTAYIDACRLNEAELSQREGAAVAERTKKLTANAEMALALLNE